MELLVIIVLFLSLCFVIYQDIKYRYIHVILPVIIFSSGLYLIKADIKILLDVMFLNVLFFVFVFSVLVLYMSVKQKRILNPFKNYFGFGDLLFFMALSPFFVLRNYIVYFIASMFFSIVLYFAFKKVIKKETIPLAGYASVLFLFIITADFLLDYSHISLLD